MIDAVVAPPGLHEYPGVEALVVAVSVADPPGQIAVEFTATEGGAFTVNVAAELVTWFT
jgi:hypothetical protein